MKKDVIIEIKKIAEEMEFETEITKDGDKIEIKHYSSSAKFSRDTLENKNKGEKSIVSDGIYICYGSAHEIIEIAKKFENLIAEIEKEIMIYPF